MKQRGASRSDPIIRIRPESVVASLGACVFVVLLFVGSGPPERPRPPVARPSIEPAVAPIGRPAATTAEGLRAFSLSVPHPVYWLGERPGTKLELTRTKRNLILVRYLSEKTPIGDSSLGYPFVATYPYPKAFNAVHKASRGKGSVVRRLARGGLAVQNKLGHELVKITVQRLPSPPVFLAYPGSDYLVEVYDRSAERALGLVTSRQVRPVR